MLVTYLNGSKNNNINIYIQIEEERKLGQHLTFGEIWIKSIWELFVLFLQLFCRSEIISKL